MLQEIAGIRFGFAKLSGPNTLNYYIDWLNNEMHGEMEYLKRHLNIKSNYGLKYKNTKTAIMLAFSYVPHPYQNKVFQGLNIARYAQGDDYHDWIITKLNNISQKLKSIFPTEEFYTLTDSAPILERDLARESGLGFFGKNTCLIDRKTGSYFLIGEILTTMELETPKVEHKGFCGTCRRCIDACPTSALVKPYVLDSRKCISYLTIESKKVPPIELRDKIGNNFFGCDICQEVCPWNESLKDKKHNAIEDLKLLLKMSDEELRHYIKGSPLERAKPSGLRRNALIVIGNQKLTELQSSIEPYANDPYLGELAKWTISKLT